MGVVVQVRLVSGGIKEAPTPRTVYDDVLCPTVSQSIRKVNTGERLILFHCYLLFIKLLEKLTSIVSSINNAHTLHTSGVCVCVCVCAVSYTHLDVYKRQK